MHVCKMLPVIQPFQVGDGGYVDIRKPIEDQKALPCRMRVSSICPARLRMQGYEDQLPPRSFIRGKRLSELSTWGIGGPAKYYTEVHDESQLASTLRYCQTQSIPVFILGKGSNCLFDDRGFDGCVILNSMDFLESDGNGIFRSGSGRAFNRLGIQCSNEGFSGLEFASGIPGTVGGAIFMNAAANGQETAEVLKSVEILTADGEKIVHMKEGWSLAYGYRKSPYQTMAGFFVITAATFELKFCLDARQRHRTYLESRRKTQPVTEQSAGCVFRNPGDCLQSAGSLIENAGLKGFSIGQAKVSEIHANFLINTGGSTAEDMLHLINLVKEQWNCRLSGVARDLKFPTELADVYVEIIFQMSVKAIDKSNKQNT